MAGPELTRQQADTELARLDAERAAISAALVELDSHPGHRLLDAAGLRGETSRRWGAAKSALASLHEQFDAYRQALDRAHELRSRRELGELTELLRGESIELTHDAVPLQRRSLTGPSAVVERIGFAALVDRMNTAFTQVTAVVAEADAKWSLIVSRLDAAQEQVRRAKALAGPLRLPETDRSLATELTRLDGDVAALREQLASDPLTVPDSAGEQFAGRASAILDRLSAITAVRDGFVERLAAAKAGLDQLRAAQADATRTRETVLVKIAESALPPVVDRSAVLLAGLDRLAGLGESGSWRQLADELPEFEREAASTIERVLVERDAIGSLLARRDELRGRLGAYQAKAAGIGHSEDRELERLFDAAHELLWTAPCNLAAATRALARYQQAVSAREGVGHG